MNDIQKLTKDWITQKLPKRPKDANKGTFGKVLVVAGSEKYPGAAYLACAAAYRVGVGLVTVATSNSVKIIIARKLPEATFLTINKEIKNLNEYNVVLVGPGLGQGLKAVKIVSKLLKEKRLPKAVIDGDGLNIFSKTKNWWNKFKKEAILTPHPGEMARLTDLSIQDIQRNREKTAQYFAKKWNKVIVLKGANTVIVSPTGNVAVSPFANPLLATAGTGDVLSGVIAGMLAQGLDLFDAACVGVHLHGMAGKMLSKKIGNAGALAGDLLPLLPITIKKLK